MSREPMISKTGQDGCELLQGAVVVIDVLRAFTTAAYAFSRGAQRIVLARSAPEAFELKHERFPAALLMGEEGGIKIDGFDHGNSPSELAELRFEGRTLIQRTTAGTKTVLMARSAEVLLVSSFVCADATVRYLRELKPGQIGLVASGKRGRFDGADDEACADYLEARLQGRSIDPQAYLGRARESAAARKFLDPEKPAFPGSDLTLALELDRFDFAMRARTREGIVIVERVAA